MISLIDTKSDKQSAAQDLVRLNPRFHTFRLDACYAQTSRFRKGIGLARLRKPQAARLFSNVVTVDKTVRNTWIRLSEIVRNATARVESRSVCG